MSQGDGANTDSAFSIGVEYKSDEPYHSAGSERILANKTDEWDIVINASNKIRIRLYDNDTSNYAQAITTTFVIAAHKWYFILATYSGSGGASNIKLYIDGNEVGLTASTNGTYNAMHNKSENVCYFKGAGG